MFTRESNGVHDVTCYGGLSASSHPWASAAGQQMLLRGGNAVDAALATAFALTVCEPAMSHLGGQGNLLVHMAAEGQTVALDHYPTAPAAARADMYDWVPSPTQGGYRFWTRGDANTTGALSVCVPGNVAGWFYLRRRWGSLPMEAIVEPAVSYARRGVPMTRRMAAFIAENQQRLAQFPASEALFLRSDGSPLQAGDVVVQPDLARTLERLAREGPELFYQGEIATAIVAALEARGGVLTLADLAEYPERRFRVEQPQAIPYRALTVQCSPPSSSAVLLPLLRLLSGFDLAAHAPLAPEKLHLLVECMKLAFADRIPYTGDRDFLEIPIDGLLSTAYQSERRRLIRSDRASFPGPGDPWPYQGGGAAGGGAADGARSAPGGGFAAAGETQTTHHSHVDRFGNFVSMTQSLGDAFGSAMVIPGYGFLLNNAMKLFDPRPGNSNSVAPHKRPGIAPAPTLVLREGKPVMALGSPSGTRILNAIAQVIVNVIDHRLGLQAAVNLPRLHWSGDELEIEADIPGEAQAALRVLGHEPQARNAKSPWFGAVQAVARDPETGLCHGAADPRRQGAVAGATIWL